MAARTAVVAGTATAVSNRTSRRQAQKWEAEDQQQYAQQQQQYEQAATGASSEDLTNQLAQLAQLRSQGSLTDEEFAAAKAKLIE
jgi:hypothetical protein